MSRSPGDLPCVFAGKLIALKGTTPGRFGITLGQNA
jgi:hypothetical protein